MALLMDIIYQLDDIMEKEADEETKKWPLMQHGRFMIFICLVYLLVVKSIGPKLMETRQPFNLKYIIIVYNIIQVIACTIIFTWTVSSRPSLGCEPYDTTANPETLNAARIVWWTMLLKLAEFIETCFFVLRKKQNQVSNLHVYHHVSTFLVCWGSTKIFPSKMILTPIMMNCFVHILMYTYYLVSATDFQTACTKFKRYITIIQMIQFGILVIYTMQIFSPYCSVPNTYAYIFIPNVFVVFYMFYLFYQTAYLNRKENIE